MGHLLKLRREFDAWIEAGSELLRDLSNQHESFKTIYGSTLASDLLGAEYARRLAALGNLRAHSCYRYNTAVSPLLCLPAEILREILVIATNNTPVKSWMSLGHVCTRVRAILRGCQSIWAENVYAVNDPICRELFLQQAGDAPLALVVKTQLDNNDALSRLPRARSIWTNQNDLTMTMLHHMPSPTKRSLLQHLTLDLDADFMEIWNSMYPEPTLPTIDFPSLHSLHLTNVNALFMCNNLSELIISDDINRPGMGYSSNEFLAVLRGCPRIQNLDLSYTLPFFSPLSSSNEIVKLDLLERLTVKSFRKCSLSFWPCISVPHTTEVEFKLDCRSTDSDDAYRGPDTFDDARLFRAHLDGIPVKDVQLCLSGDVQGQLPVVLSLRTLDNGVHKHILTLGYFNYAHDVQTHDAVCRMRDALRLAEVEKLILSRITFSSAFSDDAASWRALLLLFPKVQSLGTDLQWFQKLCFALWWTGRVPSMDPENTSSQS